MRKRSTWRKYIGMLTAVAALCAGLRMSAAAKEETAEAAAEADRQVRAAYEEYQGRLNGITRRAQIADSGFRVIEDQIFPLETDCYGKSCWCQPWKSGIRGWHFFYEGRRHRGVPDGSAGGQQLERGHA